MGADERLLQLRATLVRNVALRERPKAGRNSVDGLRVGGQSIHRTSGLCDIGENRIRDGDLCAVPGNSYDIGKRQSLGIKSDRSRHGSSLHVNGDGFEEICVPAR